MHAESIGFSPQHAVPETYCPGCGNPDSAQEHGIGCAADRVAGVRRHLDAVRRQLGAHTPDILPLVLAVETVLDRHTPMPVWRNSGPTVCMACVTREWPCEHVTALLDALDTETCPCGTVVTKGTLAAHRIAVHTITCVGCGRPGGRHRVGCEDGK
jgi:hypothetical protein